MGKTCLVAAVVVTAVAALLVGSAGLGQDADLVFSGEQAGEGHWPTTSVDVDGDGYDDLIVGAPGCNGDQGKVYLYYGGPDMDAIPDLIITLNQERPAVVATSWAPETSTVTATAISSWEHGSTTTARDGRTCSTATRERT